MSSSDIVVLSWEQRVLCENSISIWQFRKHVSRPTRQTDSDTLVVLDTGLGHEEYH